jgi:(1->4)-alpha-D-glucan 1-alpha-D-glucosylmutase
MNDRCSAADRLAATRHVPLATYRLQFNRTFRFDHARRRLGYLRDLGVSDVYASPYLKAATGSTHGYDIVDHSQINPEIGSPADYDRFVAALQRHGLRQVLDIVPNHMGIGPANRWWQDVLESGPGSAFAASFDIDWSPPRAGMENRVLLPVLGDQFGAVLDRGELRLVYDDGAFMIHYYDQVFPVAPDTESAVLQPALARAARRLPQGDEALLELQSIITAIGHLPPRTESDPERVGERQREALSIRRRLQALSAASAPVRRAIADEVRAFNGRPGEPRSFDRLADLLDRQAYRLSYWRVAAEEINYRRFFDVNQLAALRMERPEVFEATHALVLQLLAGGKVGGLRIDHPDGLRDPRGYLERLQRRYVEELCKRRSLSAAADESDVEPARSTGAPGAGPLYLVVEKILGHGERLPADWPVDGTTGYDFLNAVNGLFVDGTNRRQLDALYRSFTGVGTSFRDLAYDSKKLIMRVVLASELHVLALQLDRVAAHNRRYRDFTLNALAEALAEVIACFPIYRTYIGPEDATVSERDRLYIDLAISRAKRRNPVTDPSIYTFIQDTLTLEGDDGEVEGAGEARRDFALKFQQVCGPVTAKGVEDTAFYIYNRLVSLNEVGGDPEQFGVSVASFHRQNAERQARRPYSLLATATHDSKRGEDVRTRIDALSELPSEWRVAVRRWSRLNRRLKTSLRGQSAPDRNDEYLLYQTLVGAWPFELVDGEDAAGLQAFAARISAYMEKALREAKVHTSWISPDAAYEGAVRAFVFGVLTGEGGAAFRRDARPLLRRVAALGVYNSLAQTVLKLTSPGVPDIYQGSELWELSLVDPDNRRPVDFAQRELLLVEIAGRIAASEATTADFAAELLANRNDGRIKLFALHCLLALRRRRPELFGAAGAYVPLEATGSHAENVVAYLRRNGRAVALTAVARLVARLVRNGDAPTAAAWGDTWIVVRGEQPGTRFRELFTGATLTVEERDGASVLPLATLFATLPVAVVERINGEEELA